MSRRKNNTYMEYRICNKYFTNVVNFSRCALVHSWYRFCFQNWEIRWYRHDDIDWLIGIDNCKHSWLMLMCVGIKVNSTEKKQIETNNKQMIQTKIAFLVKQIITMMMGISIFNTLNGIFLFRSWTPTVKKKKLNNEPRTVEPRPNAHCIW